VYQQQFTPRGRNGNRPSAYNRSGPTSGSDQGRGSTGQPLCYGCGQPGHFLRNCPTSLQSESTDWSNPSSPARVRSAVVDGSTKVHLKVKIDNKTHHCLLDSGSDVNLIPARLVHWGNLRKVTRPCVAVNNTRILITGKARVTAMIGNTPIEIEGLVSPEVHEITLGAPWLSRYVDGWDFDGGRIIIRGRVYQLANRRVSPRKCRRVRLVKNTSTSRPEVNQPIENRATTPTGWGQSTPDSRSRRPWSNRLSYSAHRADGTVACRATTSTTEQRPKIAPRGPADYTTKSATDSPDFGPRQWTVRRGFPIHINDLTI